MKTLRRLIYGEVLIAVAFVSACFLALFFFFDFVDELRASYDAGAYSTRQVVHGPERILRIIIAMADVARLRCQ